MGAEMEDMKEFAKHLLIQDPPSADRQTRHREAVFNAVKRRIWLEKVITGAVYLLIFSAAFLAFLERRQTVSVVHSICWGALSLHILLWFLVYFLWRIGALLGKITQKTLTKKEDRERVGRERKIAVAAIALFVFTTLLLCFGFFLKEPLKAAQMTVLMLWGPPFFLFWFAFGAASLVSKLWLEYRTLELTANRLEDENRGYSR